MEGAGVACATTTAPASSTSLTGSTKTSGPRSGTAGTGVACAALVREPGAPEPDAGSVGPEVDSREGSDARSVVD